MMCDKEKEDLLNKACRVVEARITNGYDGKEHPEHKGLVREIVYLFGFDLHNTGRNDLP